MVTTFVKKNSLPNIRSGPHIPAYDEIYQGSSNQRDMYCDSRQVENRSVYAPRRKNKKLWGCVYLCVECLHVSLAFLACLLWCFIPADRQSDLWSSKMQKIIKHYHDDCMPCISSVNTVFRMRQATKGKGKQKACNAFYGYSAISFLKNIPYHCWCDRLICPHLAIHNHKSALLKKASAPPPSTFIPHIYTSQSLRWGKKKKWTNSLRVSYIPAISLEHAIYIYALI